MRSEGDRVTRDVNRAQAAQGTRTFRDAMTNSRRTKQSECGRSLCCKSLLNRSTFTSNIFESFPGCSPKMCEPKRPPLKPTCVSSRHHSNWEESQTATLKWERIFRKLALTGPNLVTHLIFHLCIVNSKMHKKIHM